MGLKLRRRSVYVATIVAMLAMVGGLALAFTFSSTALSSTQGGTSTTITNSLWIGQKFAATWEPATVTCGAAVGPITSTASATGVVDASLGGSGTPCTSGNFVEQIEYQAAVPSLGAGGPTTLTDTFTVYTDSSAGVGTTSIQVSVTEPTGTDVGYTATFLLNVDYGSSAPPSSITALNVVVNGPF
jgi:hypothetical protein